MMSLSAAVLLQSIIHGGGLNTQTVEEKHPLTDLMVILRSFLIVARFLCVCVLHAR